MQYQARRLLGALAMLGAIAFTAGWIVAGIAEDEYSVRQEDISALAAIDAQYPWIMITGFLLLAVGCVALAIGLASTIAGPVGAHRFAAAAHRWRRPGGRGTGAKRLQQRARRLCRPCRGWHRLLASQLHDNVSLMIFLSLVVAPLILARAFHQTDGWRDLRVYSIVTGLLTLVLLISYVAASGTSESGLVQRVFVSMPFLWIGVLGYRLVRVSGPRL